MAAPAMAWTALAFPAGFDLDAARTFTRVLATRPVRGLLRQPDPVVCEVVATVDGLRWQVGMTGREATMVLPLLCGQLPGVSLDATDRELPALSAAWELRLSNYARPLRTDVPEAVAAALLGALRDVRAGEALVWSWVIGPPLARTALQRGDIVDGALLGQSEEVTAARNKVAEPIVGAVARIGVTADGYGRQTVLAQRVVGSLELAAAPGAALGVHRWRHPTRAACRLAAHRGPLWRWPPMWS